MPSTKTFIRVSGNSKKVVTPSQAVQNALRADSLVVVMFSVGDGEAIFLRRNKQVVLIDGGAGKDAENTPLGEFLAQYVIERSLKLKAFDATHPHIDHLNAILPLLKSGGSSILTSKVKYYDNGEEYKNSLKDTLLPKLNSMKNRIEQIHVHGNGEMFTLGSEVACKLFIDGSTSHGTNYKSVFMSVTFRNAKFLFTGDVYKDYEKKLIKPTFPHVNDLPTHVLKITHHGSKEGTSQEFVDWAQPKIAVASTSHAADHRLEKQVRDRLTNSKIFDTATSGGDIIIRTDGKIHSIEGEEGILYEVEEISPGLYESWRSLRNHS